MPESLELAKKKYENSSKIFLNQDSLKKYKEPRRSAVARRSAWTTMAISMSRTLLKGLGVRQVRAYSSAMAAAPVATFLPGDGIGPEIAKSVRLVFETAGVPLQWEEHHFSPEYIDPETNR